MLDIIFFILSSVRISFIFSLYLSCDINVSSLMEMSLYISISFVINVLYKNSVILFLITLNSSSEYIITNVVIFFHSFTLKICLSLFIISISDRFVS